MKLSNTNPLWDDDLIQFARLLCEISATFSEIDVPALCESMDLEPDDIDELFERAHRAWEAAKRDPDARTEGLRRALMHVREHGFGDNVDADAIIEQAARSALRTAEHTYGEEFVDGSSINVKVTDEGVIFDTFDVNGELNGTKAMTFDEWYSHITGNY